MADATRIETDSLGEVSVPANALYGAQTQRAVDNFPISGLRLPRQLIRALGLIKAAGARVNGRLELLDAARAEAIAAAAGEVAAGKHDDHFPVDVFQTGSGTSSNMNANEVIARLAGEGVHPNDHVNLGQSSNDVFPTAIQVGAYLAIAEQLLPALDHLAVTIEGRAEEHADQVKTGRTHLMDAMPLTMGQELSAWASQIRDAAARLTGSLPRLGSLPIGGTAVGTGINTHPSFGTEVCQDLAESTGHGFRPMDNRFAGLSAPDSLTEGSGHLKTLAVALMKIANDLRWMNSGPQNGLGEIALPALQPGSSIMPGKVNPVIPEAVAMVAAQIMGNDLCVTIGGQSGTFQLNVMLPMMAHNLLQSIELGTQAARVLADKAIAGFTVDVERLGRGVEHNPILVTALNHVVGYDEGARIAKRAYADKRPIIDVALEETDLTREELTELLDPTRLTQGGIRR
ncbi:MAG: class II fumarate hydratase [Deltaproteobacteria bacterium]|nr:class II fumarate hydratase [Deltaproteobacteria bacterium]